MYTSNFKQKLGNKQASWGGSEYVVFFLMTDSAYHRNHTLKIHKDLTKVNKENTHANT